MTVDGGMSVEQPLWRALTGYRVVAALYALVLYVLSRPSYAHPLGADVYLPVLVAWTAATATRTRDATRCTRVFLACDLSLALTGILLTSWVETPARIADGASTLPSVWTAGAVLGFALKGGWRWAALAAALVAAANLLALRADGLDAVHDVLLVCFVGIGVGYAVEVARSGERTLARALRLEAATRERERLARDIHDNVLQVLAMVQRRGTALGGPAAELGRMAGEQEVALRALVANGPDADGPRPDAGTDPAAGRGGRPEPPRDVAAALAATAGSRVTFAGPGVPVLLPPVAAGELVAAVRAALDNVERHAGPGASAWILLEDHGDEVVVTVRDDGPGIPEGRLADAEDEGRMGVALSIRGRLRDLGGTAGFTSVPGQGTEVELRMPKDGA